MTKLATFLLLSVSMLSVFGCGETGQEPTGVADAGTDAEGVADAAATELDGEKWNSAETGRPGEGGWDVDDYFQVSEIGPVPEYEQREGDVDRGYDVLVNEGYVSCGIPARIYDELLARDVPEGSKLRGRRNGNEEMPYNQTRFERDGIEIVSTNCLACHANVLPTGELMVGLGYEGDHTSNLGRLVELGRGLVDEENDREVFEYDRFLTRITTVQPYIRTDTVGVNPAENLAGVLTAHRDPDTWEWLDEPWFELPDVDVVPLSVPPWWHVQKKNALYYTAIGRGDHARFMMAAALLCTDSEEEARKIDEWFVHVREYIESIDPPPYPYDIDRDLADEGEGIFTSNCSRCHGTYGADWTYPNLVVSLDEVGTDPMLAEQGILAAKPAVAWLNRSFFGEVTIAAPAPGYIAPPLDGIWATAPYMHNASVPTVEGMIDSSKRPDFWTRNFQSTQYDREALGFVFTELSSGKEAVESRDEAKLIYDTTLPGYSSQGHTFGDALTEVERIALLEYLKTL